MRMSDYFRGLVDAREMDLSSTRIPSRKTRK